MGACSLALAMRAVHLEVTHSLSADSFLAALSRFIARRGMPLKLHSDNATNLKAGDKELKEGCASLAADNKVYSALLEKRIEWVFNPPHASHMGGLWERLIRSVRSILRVIVGQQLLNDEALLTVMAEAERIVNDRPLTTVSSDSRDPEILTPNKILLLRGTASSFPLGTFTKEDCYSKRWWKQAQYLSNQFWRRWQREYIPRLMERQKWRRPRRCLHEGDIVLISDLQLPRGRWPLAKVISTTAGRDGLIRSATVKTATTTLTRPATQLCLLEASAD